MSEGDARALGAPHGLFGTARQLWCASAPGRLDVMGGFADYSGSLVLQLPLRLRAHAAVGARADRVVRAVSLAGKGSPETRTFTLNLDALLAAADSGDSACRSLFAELDRAALYASIERDVARAVAKKYGIDDLELSLDRQTGQFRCNYEVDLQEQGRLLAEAVKQSTRDKLVPRDDWARYAVGSVAMLCRERGVRPRAGFDLLLASDVPEGKGVASSAAIEVACASAIAQMMGVALAPRELAMLCQRVENEVVGAACGVMDQMTAACGEEGSLLRLLCQPAEIEGHVPVPAGFKFFGVDSGVRHAVSGTDYTSVRIGAFMGWRILGDVALPRWGSYLANVTLDEWTARAAYVPERMLGADFLARYGETRDPATRVDPTRTYAVRQPTAHPIFEHARVREFADLLPHAAEPGVAERLGTLMAESHASYSACGLGNAATDAIVAEARAIGPAGGVFGAKITGGGSGGTVAVFARADVDAARRFGAARLIGASP